MIQTRQKSLNFKLANETCATIFHRYTHLMLLLLLLTEIQWLLVKIKLSFLLENKRKSISMETERRGLKASSSPLTASWLIRIKPGLSLPPSLYHHSAKLSSSLMIWPFSETSSCSSPKWMIVSAKTKWQNERELHCKLQLKCWHFCKNCTYYD